MQYSAITRRGFISAATAALAGTSFAREFAPPSRLGVSMMLEPLGFPFEALSPHFKTENLKRHYQEHHADYQRELRDMLEAEELCVGNLMTLMPGMERMIHPSKKDFRMPLGKLVKLGVSFQAPQQLSKEAVQTIRQAGGGHINHTLFWRMLCPAGTGSSGPQGKLARAIQEDFGSIKTFRRVFKEQAMSMSCSGWAWLIYRQDGCLIATTTANEDNPMMKDHVPWQYAGRPILALDLWEHSYYEQYQDDRERYIDAWWNVVNWEYVKRAYESMVKRA